jgi:phosphopantothenoylcysteine synthetase/decarboxylase
MGRRILVTAGNTRERIDAVRCWGNIFTGRTGLLIARELARSHPVDLLTSNSAHLHEASVYSHEYPGLTAHEFDTHADLRDAIGALLAQHEYEAVFMTAAVADYAPSGVFEVLERSPDPADPAVEMLRVRNVTRPKVASTHREIAVLGNPTPKIVDMFRGTWNYQGLLVKFKLEVGIGQAELLEIARRSRVASGADYLVANTLDMVEGDSSGAFLVSERGEEWIPRALLPARMRRVIEEHQTP